MNKITSFFVLLTFMVSCVVPPRGFAQTLTGAGILPEPGAMVAMSGAFTPAHLIGVTIDPTNALKFDFLIHKGELPLSLDQKKEEYRQLIKYFLAALTVPNDNQWVNLSPYENKRIIKDDFGLTEMGRDLLAQDYLLKQLTASLMHPDSDIGKKFWERVYERAYQQFGTTDVPVDTFNKVWIVPENVSVYEKDNTALIVGHHLKVLTERDYVATENNSIAREQGEAQEETKATQVSSEIVKEVIIPELEREVNEGKTFANLRQIYGAMILATWFKQSLRESILGKAYADRAKVKGVDQDPKNNEAIYQQYLQAYKKGVFNMIKEDVDRYSEEVIPRKYFSGGAKAPERVSPATFAQLRASEVVSDATDNAIERAETALATESLSIAAAQETTDLAMTVKDYLSDLVQQLAQAKAGEAEASRDLSGARDSYVWQEGERDMADNLISWQEAKESEDSKASAIAEAHSRLAGHQAALESLPPVIEALQNLLATGPSIDLTEVPIIQQILTRWQEDQKKKQQEIRQLKQELKVAKNRGLPSGIKLSQDRIESFNAETERIKARIKEHLELKQKGLDDTTVFVDEMQALLSQKTQPKNSKRAADVQRYIRSMEPRVERLVEGVIDAEQRLREAVTQKYGSFKASLAGKTEFASYQRDKTDAQKRLEAEQERIDRFRRLTQEIISSDDQKFFQQLIHDQREELARTERELSDAEDSLSSAEDAPTYSEGEITITDDHLSRGEADALNEARDTSIREASWRRGAASAKVESLTSFTNVIEGLLKTVKVTDRAMIENLKRAVATSPDQTATITVKGKGMASWGPVNTRYSVTLKGIKFEQGLVKGTTEEGKSVTLFESEIEYDSRVAIGPAVDYAMGIGALKRAVATSPDQTATITVKSKGMASWGPVDTRHSVTLKGITFEPGLVKGTTEEGKSVTLFESEIEYDSRVAIGPAVDYAMVIDRAMTAEAVVKQVREAIYNAPRKDPVADEFIDRFNNLVTGETPSREDLVTLLKEFVSRGSSRAREGVSLMRYHQGFERPAEPRLYMPFVTHLEFALADMDKAMSWVMTANEARQFLADLIGPTGDLEHVVRISQRDEAPQELKEFATRAKKLTTNTATHAVTVKDFLEWYRLKFMILVSESRKENFKGKLSADDVGEISMSIQDMGSAIGRLSQAINIERLAKSKKVLPLFAQARRYTYEVANLIRTGQKEEARKRLAEYNFSGRFQDKIVDATDLNKARAKLERAYIMTRVFSTIKDVLIGFKDALKATGGTVSGDREALAQLDKARRRLTWGPLAGFGDRIRNNDFAQTASEDSVTQGGIDFNEQYIRMNIKRDGNGVPLPVGQQDLDNIKIDGLVPNILSIQPVTSLPILSQAMGTGASTG